MNLRLQPVQVATGSSDTQSCLVFSDGFLVAVLVRLSDDHGDAAGAWFLEVGFVPVDHPKPPTFTNLDEAQDWVAQRLAGTL